MQEAMEQTQLGLREDPLNWLLRMSPGLFLWAKKTRWARQSC